MTEPDWTCPDCSGTGWVIEWDLRLGFDIEIRKEKDICARCSGQGKIEAGGM